MIRKRNFILPLVMFFLFSLSLSAQDSIKIRKAPHGDEYCWPVIATGNGHSTDSLSLQALQGDNIIELRINDDCPVKKKADVFVISFEIGVDTEGRSQSIAVPSSFFNGPQKKLILSLQPGQFFMVKNIVIHAPDGFRKMDNFKVTLTN